MGRCASTPLASVLLLRPSGFPLRPLESSRHRRPRGFSAAVHPPVGSGPPPEYDGTSPLLCLSEERGSSSHEVHWPFRAVNTVGPLPRRVPTRRRLPPSGFRNLSAVFSPRCLASLFRLAGTPRLSPSGLSLSREPCLLSEVVTLLPLPASFLFLAEAIRRGTGFRVLLPLEVRCSTVRLFTVRELGALLGFPLSRVLSPPAVAHVSVSPPLASFGRGRTGRPRKPAPQGLPEPESRRVSRETCRPS